MRVLMFGWEFPPAQAGGLATATLGLVKGLLRSDVAVTLVVPFPMDAPTVPGLRLLSTAGEFRRARRGGASLWRAADDQLRVWRVPAPLHAYGGAAGGAAPDQVSVHYQPGSKTGVLADRSVTDVIPAANRGADVYGVNLMADVERFADVAALIAEEEPHDVIDTHDWITFGAGISAAAASGRPLVAHIHATEMDRSGEWINGAIAVREREGMHAAARVISTSSVLARRVTQVYDVLPDRIDIVPLGIDHREEPWSASRATNPFGTAPVVLFLGRVTHQKGPERFLEVARRVADFVPRAHFVVAGTGDLLPHIIERTVELGLAEQVHFTGALRGAEVKHAFGMADVCVMPSVSEPFGLVALESLRAGTPCIIPRDAGVAEVLRNAFKVESWDVEEMTDKIVAIIRYPELLAELRDRATAELLEERFGLELPARRTRAVYERVVRESAAPARGHAAHYN
jgi:glycosyltransferase involved in cell wall biosynthesis